MANPQNQASQGSQANPASTMPPGPAPGPAASTNEVTALLLEVLRNVNRQVETTRPSDNGATRELEGDAQKAVVHFRQISLELRTSADGSASFGPAPATTGTASAGTPAAPAAAAASARPR